MAPYVHHFEGNRRVWDYIESERLRAFDLSSAHCTAKPTRSRTEICCNA